VNDQHREAKWESKTRIKSQEYDGFDFFKTDFNSPIFEGVIFRNCRFDRSNLDDARTNKCLFINCSFYRVDLSNVSIGCYGGLYENCEFIKCDFRNGCFYQPEFINCIFDNCKWKGAELKASSFENCKFIGKLQDMVFCGMYQGITIDENAKPNTMKGVDFSEAVFVEYVEFDNCDLSQAIPPKGTTFSTLLTTTKFKGRGYLTSTPDDPEIEYLL
jgi:uncharacterized protein YjbI with pentapeptide repeats